MEAQYKEDRLQMLETLKDGTPQYVPVLDVSKGSAAYANTSINKRNKPRDIYGEDLEIRIPDGISEFKIKC